MILLCVPSSAIVRELLFGKGGLAEGLSPGKIVIDQTRVPVVVCTAANAALASTLSTTNEMSVFPSMETFCTISNTLI